jgi:hypothetical protein
MEPIPNKEPDKSVEPKQVEPKQVEPKQVTQKPVTQKPIKQKPVIKLPPVTLQISGTETQKPVIKLPPVTLQIFGTETQKPVTAEETKRQYLIISIPTGGEPKLNSVRTRNNLKQVLRSVYGKTDQQFLYVIRGELADLFKIRNGLIVRFGDDEKIHVPNKNINHELIRDGWLGD